MHPAVEMIKREPNPSDTNHASDTSHAIDTSHASEIPLAIQICMKEHRDTDDAGVIRGAYHCHELDDKKLWAVIEYAKAVLRLQATITLVENFQLKLTPSCAFFDLGIGGMNRSKYDVAKQRLHLDLAYLRVTRTSECFSKDILKQVPSKIELETKFLYLIMKEDLGAFSGALGKTWSKKHGNLNNFKRLDVGKNSDIGAQELHRKLVQLFNLSNCHQLSSSM